jgi:hypothetical protein
VEIAEAGLNQCAQAAYSKSGETRCGIEYEKLMKQNGKSDERVSANSDKLRGNSYRTLFDDAWHLNVDECSGS